MSDSGTDFDKESPVFELLILVWASAIFTAKNWAQQAIGHLKAHATPWDKIERLSRPTLTARCHLFLPLVVGVFYVTDTCKVGFHGSSCWLNEKWRHAAQLCLCSASVKSTVPFKHIAAVSLNIVRQHATCFWSSCSAALYQPVMELLFLIETHVHHSDAEARKQHLRRLITWLCVMEHSNSLADIFQGPLQPDLWSLWTRSSDPACQLTSDLWCSEKTFSFHSSQIPARKSDSALHHLLFASWVLPEGTSAVFRV